MIAHLNTPFFGPDTIRDALESMRKGESIQRSPLLKLVWIRTLDHWGAFSEVAVDVVLRDALAEIIEAQLTSHRAYEELSVEAPQTRSEVLDRLRADFQVQNAELEAWSVLYHRYVRLDFGLQMQALADAVFVTTRQIRRRLTHGCFRLAEEVTRLEQEARRHNQRLVLSVKLLPPTYARLFGRESLCDDLVRHIEHNDQSHVTVLTGPGGIGKSAVAHQVTGRLIETDHFDDLIWITLDREVYYADFLMQIVQALSYVPVFEQGEHAVERNIGVRLRQVRTLMIVDPIDQLKDFDAHLAQIGHLIGAGHVLATSRYVPASEAPVTAVPVAPLDDDSFRDFLTHEFRRQRLATPSEETIQMIMKMAGGNPLAGKLIVRQMKALPLETIMADLGDQPTFDDARLFDYLFGRIWESLTPTARSVAIGLILLPDTETAYEDLRRILTFEEDAVQAALSLLVEVSLVTVSERPPRYQMSALIRQFVWREASSESHRPTLQDLIAAVRTVGDSEGTSLPTSIDQVLGLIDDRELLRLSEPDLRDLLHDVGHRLRRSGQWRRWQHMLDRVQSRISGTDTNLSAVLPLIWLELGTAHRQQGNIGEAEGYAHQAVAAFGEAGDFQGQGRALIELGRAYEARGMEEPAFEAYQRSAAAGERHRDDELWRRAANRLANQVLHQGRPEEALTYLALHESKQGEEEDAEALLLQGQAHLAKGDFTEASNLLDAAQQAFIEEGDVAQVARTHFPIALAAYQVGDADRFFEHLQQGFGLMYALGDFIGLSRLITLMGIVRLEEGLAERALTIWEAARELQTVIGDSRGEAFTLFHLTDLYWKIGRRDDARQALARARTLAEQQAITILIEEIANHPLLSSGGGGYNIEE